MSEEPNVDFGAPIIFFDSHPEEQESYLYSYWSSLKSSFHIAFTGEVPKFHHPGSLRLIWYTHDGNQGLKDYELHEYALVRSNFDVLLAMDEIRRVVIMGYSGQNPYISGAGGRNPWRDRFEREFAKMKREGRTAKLSQEKLEGKAGEEERERIATETKERLDNSKEGRTGVLVDIEEVIDRHDKAEEEKRRLEMDKMWKENEGLLSGAMV